MVTKYFSKAHGSSLVPMAIGTLAVAAIAAVAGTSSATVIFQDNFTGNATTPLNGAAPTTGPAGATWVAGSGWYDNGTETSSGAGNSNAYLPYTVTAGNVYTLSAGLNPNNVFGGWFGLGFISNTPSTGVNYWFAGSGGGYLNAGPWLSVTGTRGDTSGNEGLYNPGPGHSGGYTAFATTSGVQNVSIVLNTTAASWTFQVFNNNSSVGPVVSLASNPNIVGVALGDNGSPMANGAVSDFSLTVTPVPETPTLALAGVGAMGLLLLKRRCLV
ncbi:MAG: hypothetical protein M0Z50_18265 [Planctomycetia bacterium]|jgi:hypothetical protein|nr:hypothetical protein [Planctomycetia bacterium]